MLKIKHVKTVLVRVNCSFFNQSAISQKNVPDKLTCVLWQDGGGTQLVLIVNGIKKEINISAIRLECQHVSSTSAQTQPCDIQAGLRTVQSLNKTTTSVELPVVGYKGNIFTLINELKQSGIVKLKKVTQGCNW